MPLAFLTFGLSCPYLFGQYCRTTDCLTQRKAPLKSKKINLHSPDNSLILGLGSIFSFNLWQDILVFNQHIFELITNTVTEIMLPVGGLGFSLFVGWVLTHEDFNKGFTQKETLSRHYCIVCIRYITPLAMLTILWKGL